MCELTVILIFNIKLKQLLKIEKIVKIKILTFSTHN